MAIIFGNTGSVSFTSGGDAQLVAQINQWSLDIQQTVIEGAKFGDAFYTRGKGQGRWDGSFSGHIDSAGAMTATTTIPANGAILLRYYDSTTDGTYAGNVVFRNVRLNVDADGNATISADFAGTLAYTHTLSA